MEPYKTFVVTFDSIKLNLFIINDSVAINKDKNISRDDEEAPKDS